MTELKTLKELCISKDDSWLFTEGAKIQRENIKQEAIKWYKSLHKRMVDKKLDDYTESVMLGQIEILKLFFDLNEEDLK